MQAMVNRVISLWRGRFNVALVSSTDEKFIEELKQWAKRKGYRIEETGAANK